MRLYQQKNIPQMSLLWKRQQWEAYSGRVPRGKLNELRRKLKEIPEEEKVYFSPLQTGVYLNGTVQYFISKGKKKSCRIKDIRIVY